MNENQNQSQSSEGQKLQTAEAFDVRALRRLAAERADTINRLQAELRLCARNVGCDESAHSPSFVVAAAIGIKDSEIADLKSEIESLKKERDHNRSVISGLQQTNRVFSDEIMAVRRCVLGGTLPDSRIGMTADEIVAKKIADLNMEIASLNNQLTVMTEASHDIRRFALRMHHTGESSKSTLQLLMDKIDELGCSSNQLHDENVILRTELEECFKNSGVGEHQQPKYVPISIVVATAIAMRDGKIKQLTDEVKRLNDELSLTKTAKPNVNDKMIARLNVERDDCLEEACRRGIKIDELMKDQNTNKISAEDIMIENMAEQDAMRKMMSDCVIDMLNNAFKQDPIAIHSMLVNRVPCCRDLGERSEVLVEPCNVLPGNHTVSAFGLIHGIMDVLELSGIECRWKEGQKSMIMTGFQKKQSGC